MGTVGAYRYSGINPSTSRSTRKNRLRGRRAWARETEKLRHAFCEVLEPRLLLSAALDAQIPKTIPINSGAQTLLAPSDNVTTLASNSTSVASSAAYRFVLNNAAPGQTTLFYTTLDPSSFAGADTATVGGVDCVYT